MATNSVSMGPQARQTDIAAGPYNPSPVSADQQTRAFDFPEGYEQMVIQTIQLYRDGWGPNRLMRIADWMRNVLMFRGSQLLGWDDSSKTYFDALSWYRTEGRKDSDGDDTYLDRYANNITQMLGEAFVGTMSRAVPPTVVRPENAEVLADVTTAKAAQEAISIIERQNDIRSMVIRQNHMMYLYGAYFKYTRAVMDSEAGFDEEDQFGEIDVSKPDRFHCFRCGKDTPANEFDGNQDKSCPSCGTVLGDEAYYQAESSKQISIVGQRKVPRAMVRWTVHNPLEIDVDPKADTIRDTPLLAFDQEVDIGSLRLTYPEMFLQITDGAEIATTANASYERLQRQQVYSLGLGPTSDSRNQNPTFSQNWLQPTAYGKIGKKEFSEWMQKTFPDGCKISLVGTVVVDVRPAILVKEWTCCRLNENVGMYPPSIADNVVPYNIRLNNTMDQIDDWIQRCAAGMTIYDQSKIDRREMAGKVMAPGVLNGITTKGAGIDKPIQEAIMQFDFRLDPQALTYPSMLINYAEMISGVVPQTFGAGTQDNVDTYKGQAQALDMAQTKLDIYWKYEKSEHAQASQNALECLQTLMKAGAVGEIHDVIEANGSEFRNNYVDWNKMRGHIKVYPDIDQGLPQSPQQIRQTMMQLVEMGPENPIAAALLDLIPNQESFMASCGTPDMVLPGAAQRSRTLQAINTLMESDYLQTADAQGNIQPQLPVMPEKRVENFKVARDTMQLFWQENGDYAKSNPGGWQRTMEYYDALVEMEAGTAADEAQRQLKVKMAGMPPPPPKDPMQQAAAQMAMQDGAQAVTRLMDIADGPPPAAGVNITPLVSAASKVAQIAVDTAKMQQGGK